MRHPFALLVLSALLALAAGSAAAESHPITVHDLVAFDRVSSPVVSPDGATIVFSVSRLDLEANRRRTALWRVGADGAGLARLTADDASEPVFSPDGATLYFLSSRSGTAQVWRMSLRGGEAERLTDLPLDVDAFKLSPDGTRLLLAMQVFVGTTPAATKARLDETAKRIQEGPSGRLFDRLPLRHWDTWEDGRRSHLFVLPVAGGTPVDVMKAMDADSPSDAGGSADEFEFTPDGRAVVFTAKDVGREEMWSTDFDLYVVPADGSAAPRCLTEANTAWDTDPVFSPDGRWLAYRAMQVPGYEADRFRIVLQAWPDGPKRVLTEGWDRSPESIVWSRDGRTIYTDAEHLGQNALFAIDVASGKVRTLVPQGTARSPQLAGGRLVYALEHLRSPAELWSVRVDGADAKALTRINAAKVAATRMGEPQQFRFAGAGGDTVYGYVVKPADFDPAKRYPVALLVHGGPQGSFGNDFHYRWNPQTYAGAGYAVVTVDFHGSTGYGQAFCDAIQGDWGGKPLEDLQKGLAAALAQNPWMDGGRVAALGASYGAYMMNWIQGAWPDRFRCLVSHDGNLDERGAYFDTEELWFPERDHQGTPWENPESYEKHNPVNLVAKWKTPMLVVHGGRDFRIPETQGMMTFTALQRRGIPSRFLHFPDENHWVLKPRNSILWHETVLAWLDQWTKP